MREEITTNTIRLLSSRQRVRIKKKTLNDRPEIANSSGSFALFLDTLDLQDHESPSAKDHNSGSHISQNSHDIAPSQANALMNVVNEQAHEQHDLRIATNGIDSIGKPGDMHTTGSNMTVQHDDMIGTDDDEEDEDDEDMLDKMSSSPSISDEDIDFEFVYALHTFIATVEGQANATKGDTMVLLDDSNSYWWLVRVVKDSSIG